MYFAPPCYPRRGLHRNFLHLLQFYQIYQQIPTSKNRLQARSAPFRKKRRNRALSFFFRHPVQRMRRSDGRHRFKKPLKPCRPSPLQSATHERNCSTAQPISRQIQRATPTPPPPSPRQSGLKDMGGTLRGRGA